MIILQLIISCVTLLTMWLAGSEQWSRRGKAWKLALVNQGFWITFIILTDAWGLLPLTTALVFVYGRNLVKWYELPKHDFKKPIGWIDKVEQDKNGIKVTGELYDKRLAQFIKRSQFGPYTKED